MSSFRREFRVVKKHLLQVSLFAGTMLIVSAVAHAEGLRQSIAKPLQAAEDDISTRQFGAALKAVGKADAVPDKSAYEALTIERVRAAIDASRPDYAAAASDYAVIIATGTLAPDELHTMAQAEASSDYQAANYVGAISTIKAYLPSDPQFQTILLQSYLKMNNCGELTKAAAKLPKPPPEADLQMVAYCDATTKNTDAYGSALKMLVEYYPSPAYWSELFGVEQANPEFSDRLALDFFRLKLATGVAIAEPEYMEMTQVALQSGLPNEAAMIINKGFSSGVLGSGPDTNRQGRLKALVIKQQTTAAANVAQQVQAANAAQDEAAVFAIGMNQVDGGDTGGLQIMADEIRSGKLSRPDQAELELGIAYREAGQLQNAKAVWKSIEGGDGDAELGKLWLCMR